jgi:hypothetical protein
LYNESALNNTAILFKNMYDVEAADLFKKGLGLRSQSSLQIIKA